MSNVKRLPKSRSKPRGKAKGGKVNSNNLKTNKKRPKKQIKSKEAYEMTMKEIDLLMKRGEDNLSQKDLERLRILAEAAERYEDIHDPLLHSKLTEAK